MWFIPGFLISIATFPGVIIHELAHVAFCKFTDTRVLRVCYFRVGNPAGYVIHEQPSTVWRHIMIGIGPFFVNTFLGFTIGILAIPMHMDLEHPTLVQLVLLWLGISIAMHSFPSTGDAKSIWHAVWSKGTPMSARLIGSPLVLIIFAGALGSILFLDLVYGIGIVGAAGALEKKSRRGEVAVIKDKRAGEVLSPDQRRPNKPNQAQSDQTHEFDISDAVAWLAANQTEDDFLTAKAQAERGDPEAQLSLSESYRQGVHIERDYAEALRWARKAADQNSVAQYVVARFYAEGWGIERDVTEALKWLLKASYNDLSDAQMSVADHYYLEGGNSVEAYAWLNIAAKRDKKAAERRDNMEKWMTKTEVAAAQQRSREINAVVRSQSSLPRTSSQTSSSAPSAMSESDPTATPYVSEKVEPSSQQTSDAPPLVRADQIADEFMAAIGNCEGFHCEDAACHLRRVRCMKRASAVAQRLLDTPSLKQPRRLARAYIEATQAYEELVTVVTQRTTPKKNAQPKVEALNAAWAKFSRELDLYGRELDQRTNTEKAEALRRLKRLLNH